MYRPTTIEYIHLTITIFKSVVFLSVWLALLDLIADVGDIHCESKILCHSNHGYKFVNV